MRAEQEVAFDAVFDVLRRIAYAPRTGCWATMPMRRKSPPKHSNAPASGGPRSWVTPSRGQSRSRPTWHWTAPVVRGERGSAGANSQSKRKCRIRMSSYDWISRPRFGNYRVVSARSEKFERDRIPPYGLTSSREQARIGCQDCQFRL